MFEYIFNSYNLEVLIQLLIASLFGGIIGFERLEHNQFAGLRTHIIVCIGAASVMIAGDFAVNVLNLETDPTRMAAQVISGIGFLGAGAILTSTENDKIKGLTTAAGLWTTACIGLLIGLKAYIPSFILTLVMMLANIFLRPISRYFLAQNHFVILTIRYSKETFFENIIEAIYKAGAKKIKIIELSEEVETGSNRIMLKVYILPDFSIDSLSKEINNILGVIKFSVKFQNSSKELNY